MATVDGIAVGVGDQLQATTPPAQVELFSVDASPITAPTPTDPFYFYNGTDFDGQPVVFRGNTYVPMPIEVKGFGRIAQDGTLPRPKVKVGNANGYLSSLLLSYDNLIGALFTRIVTWEPFLDGHAEEDPIRVREEVEFIINRLLAETKYEIEWELRFKSDQRLQIPRKMISPVCPPTVLYRGSTCGWAGPNYDINDVRQGQPGYTGTDECAKRLYSCKVRWQLMDQAGEDPLVVLPFGGYPGAARPIA